MLENDHYLKLLTLFTFFLGIGLQQNPGFGLITGIFLLFTAIGIIFYKLEKQNIFTFIVGGEDILTTIIRYVLFYLFLVLFSLIMSWFNLLKDGIQGYKINSITLALKRPVYFIYFSFIFLILITYIFIANVVSLDKEIVKQIIYSLLISFFFFFNYLNLLVESGPCNKINEKDIVQSFDCEEIKINKIDE